MLAEIFGPDLIIVIVVIAVVLFGGSQIPQLARSLGSAPSEFKKGLSEGGKGAAAESEATDAAASDKAASDKAASDKKE
ncbi:MAG: twin-arginine translocase TatA/TatE family subunit [Acidimicrobiales bacterium]